MLIRVFTACLDGTSIVSACSNGTDAVELCVRCWSVIRPKWVIRSSSYLKSRVRNVQAGGDVFGPCLKLGIRPDSTTKSKIEALSYVPCTCITLRREDVIMVGFIADYEVIQQRNSKKVPRRTLKCRKLARLQAFHCSSCHS